MTTCNFPDCHRPVATGNANGMCEDHERCRVLGSYVPDGNPGHSG
jgi:hypothetical protein